MSRCSSRKREPTRVEFCDTALIEQAQFDKMIVPRGTTTPVYEH
ncbi:hypothetical protein [Rhodococcus aetherivorans]|nr:hypothetical protein [Rhodococcus aetherivorans]